MKKRSHLCPFCTRPTLRLNLYCLMCRRFVWRLPQVIAVVILTLPVLGGVIWLLDYFARRSH